MAGDVVGGGGEICGRGVERMANRQPARNGADALNVGA